MSAVWLKLITVLCLSCIALSSPESSEVVWKDVGGAVTIQCGCKLNQEFLTLKKGISEDFQVFHKDGKSGKTTIATEFTDRLQENGVFPNVDILIKNLTSDDTGPYWCQYRRFDRQSASIITEKGTGSVLLVVRDTVQQCEPSTKNLVLVPVVITAAVLLAIIMGFLIWIILKTKTLRTTTAKLRHITTNDVYEDMQTL